MDLIYIDFKKAFDKVYLSILVNVLDNSEFGKLLLS